MFKSMFNISWRHPTTSVSVPLASTVLVTFRAPSPGVRLYSSTGIVPVTHVLPRLSQPGDWEIETSEANGKKDINTIVE